jgi:hypothetical protein
LTWMLSALPAFAISADLITPDFFFADLFRVAILGRFLSKNLYGCANPVCSLTRREFCKRERPNAQKIGSTVTLRHQAASAHFDWRHKYFALDSSAHLLHSGITSQTSSAAGPAKLIFASQP